MRVCRFLAAGDENFNQVQEEEHEPSRATNDSNSKQAAPYIFIGPFDLSQNGEQKSTFQADTKDWRLCLFSPLPCSKNYLFYFFSFICSIIIYLNFSPLFVLMFFLGFLISHL